MLGHSPALTTVPRATPGRAGDSTGGSCEHSRDCDLCPWALGVAIAPNPQQGRFSLLGLPASRTSVLPGPELGLCPGVGAPWLPHLSSGSCPLPHACTRFQGVGGLSTPAAFPAFQLSLGPQTGPSDCRSQSYCWSLCVGQRPPQMGSHGLPALSDPGAPGAEVGDTPPCSSALC